MCPTGLRISWRGRWGGPRDPTEMVRAYAAECVADGHRVELRAIRGQRREVVTL